MGQGRRQGDRERETETENRDQRTQTEAEGETDFVFCYVENGNVEFVLSLRLGVDHQDWKGRR